MGKAPLLNICCFIASSPKLWVKRPGKLIIVPTVFTTSETDSLFIAMGPILLLKGSLISFFIIGIFKSFKSFGGSVLILSPTLFIALPLLKQVLH